MGGAVRGGQRRTPTCLVRENKRTLETNASLKGKSLSLQAVL